MLVFLLDCFLLNEDADEVGVVRFEDVLDEHVDLLLISLVEVGIFFLFSFFIFILIFVHVSLFVFYFNYILF